MPVARFCVSFRHELGYDILGFKAGVLAHHLKKSYELLHAGIAPTSPCFSEGLGSRQSPLKGLSKVVPSWAGIVSSQVVQL